MSMPDFIMNVESGEDQPDWLNPATVADLSDSDFGTLPTRQREALFHAVERFQEIAALGADANPAEQAEARSALGTILDVLRPYRTPESQAIREAIWKAWKDHKDEIPTFDYELTQNWMDTPIVWVWLVLRDDLDVEAPSTRELLGRVRMAIRMEFHAADIERRPNIGIRSESEVKELATRSSA
jgi:hypothetical protein